MKAKIADIKHKRQEKKEQKKDKKARKKVKKITSRFTSDILAGFDPPQIERANSETDLNNVSLDIDQLMTALNESRGASRHAMHNSSAR